MEQDPMCQCTQESSNLFGYRKLSLQMTNGSTIRSRLPLCCKCMFQVFQRCVVSVSYGCCKVDRDLAYVASVLEVRCKRLFKCFIGFRYMLQVFYLDVAYVSSVCSKCFICFSKCFMLQVCTASVGVDEGGRAMPRPPTRGGA